MGILISTLDSEQLNTYQQSVQELVGVIRQKDTTFAQLIERATSSSDLVASQSSLQAIVQYVRSRPSCSNRTSDDTGEAPKPVHRNKYFLAFLNNLKQRQNSIQILLQERLPKWTEEPFSFWGRVDPLSQLSLSAALRRLCVYIENFDEEIIISPIRRRLSLARLNECREVVERRIEYLAGRSQIKVKKGATYKSISVYVLSKLACETSGEVKIRSKFLSQLRAGERYSRLQIGMLLALGDVQFDGMERCSWNDFEIIAQYCDTVSPDFILELGKVAIVLKQAIWDSELNFTELDLIIISLLSPTSHPYKEPISYGQPGRPPKRKATSYNLQNKKQCQGIQRYTISSPESDGGQRNINTAASCGTQTRLDKTITPCDTRDGGLRENTHDEQRLQSLQDTNNSMGITNYDDNASDTTWQEANSWFDDDPATLTRLRSDERHSVVYNDNSAAPPDMGQEFTFIDDPAALAGMSQEFPFTFIDGPAALAGMSQEFPSHFVDDPAATLSTSNENFR
ncbi:hypothetical protein SBOR_8999 [Sclerotinia borealis F-4128]|uniref:Uncharacterized protein n=1 Tax=Sclerotinia borealis (strain F-4128) TaxID=1432307 RepID=W9C413_SCLBF|nr:hypothetical protein SBOR_8999 [Sclerotinia borealis F-4128]